MSNLSATASVFQFLDATHRDIDKNLRALVTLLEAIESEGLNPANRAQALEVLAYFRGEARQHHIDEEKHIFPPLLSSQDPQVVDVAKHLTQDHGWLEQTWLEIDPSLEAAALGNQWFDTMELHHAVDVFLALYQDHMVLEETRAYPHARERLLEQHSAGMGREMARRRAEK